MYRSTKLSRDNGSTKAQKDISEDHLSDIIDDVKHLGIVKYEGADKRLIQKKYFIDLVALIRFHVRSEFHEQKVELLKKRRALFEAGDEQGYEDVVREIYLKQETLFN